MQRQKIKKRNIFHLWLLRFFIWIGKHDTLYVCSFKFIQWQKNTVFFSIFFSCYCLWIAKQCGCGKKDIFRLFSSICICVFLFLHEHNKRGRKKTLWERRKVKWKNNNQDLESDSIYNFTRKTKWINMA